MRSLLTVAIACAALFACNPDHGAPNATGGTITPNWSPGTTYSFTPSTFSVALGRPVSQPPAPGQRLVELLGKPVITGGPGDLALSTSAPSPTSPDGPSRWDEVRFSSGEVLLAEGTYTFVFEAPAELATDLRLFRDLGGGRYGHPFIIGNCFALSSAIGCSTDGQLRLDLIFAGAMAASSEANLASLASVTVDGTPVTCSRKGASTGVVSLQCTGAHSGRVDVSLGDVRSTDGQALSACFGRSGDTASWVVPAGRCGVWRGWE